MPDSIPAGAITLRRWDESHLDPLLDAITNSIDDLAQWMDWAADGVPSRETLHASLAAAASDFDGGLGWQYSMFDSDGSLVGGCGLHRTGRDDCTSISYWVRSDRHGRGYATDATSRLTSAAFASLPWLNAIQIQMDCANIASARIPERLGFRFIRTESHEITARGQTGKRYSWAIVRRDWPTSQSPPLRSPHDFDPGGP